LLARATLVLFEDQVTSWVTLISRPSASRPTAVKENERPMKRVTVGGLIVSDVSVPTTTMVASSPVSLEVMPVIGSLALMVVVPGATALTRLLSPKMFRAWAIWGSLEE